MALSYPLHLYLRQSIALALPNLRLTSFCLFVVELYLLNCPEFCCSLCWLSKVYRNISIFSPNFWFIFWIFLTSWPAKRQTMQFCFLSFCFSPEEWSRRTSVVNWLLKVEIKRLFRSASYMLDRPHATVWCRIPTKKRNRTTSVTCCLINLHISLFFSFFNLM